MMFVYSPRGMPLTIRRKGRCFVGGFEGLFVLSHGANLLSVWIRKSRNTISKKPDYIKGRGYPEILILLRYSSNATVSMYLGPYQALFFRDYFVPDEDDIEGLQHIEIDDHGNKTGNDSINYFLNNYIQIYLLYKKGALDEAAYRVVVQSLLNKV